MEPLVNMHLAINEVSLKNHLIEGDNFQIKPRFTRSIKKLNENNMIVELRVEIQNTKEDPFPVDITVSMSGIFDISKLEEKDIRQFVEIQSVQLMLPHIRNLIATLTTASLMAPLMLPIYDARKLFAE